jgi:putative acetyltransferase
LDIRQENTKDFSEVFEVNETAFGGDSEARLVGLLRRTDAFIPELSLVAVSENKVIGHILFTRIMIRTDGGKEYESLALAPMAVRPAFQKRGVGGQLIRRGLDRARQLGHKSVIVLGHEHYYPKFGFVPAEKWNIRSPYDVPSNSFMAIELVNEGLNGVSGMVEYPKEFGEV